MEVVHMGRTVRSLLIAALLAAPLASHLSADPAASALYLGPRTYSIHVAGTAQDAVEELRKVAGHRFGFMGAKRDQPTPNETAPVSLDFTDATLDKILLSLCEQAKLVYGLTGEADNIVLRPGDINVDSRPTAVLDDYTVRVNRVYLGSGISVKMRWGGPAYGGDESHVMNVDLEVTARTPEARRLFGGIDTGIKATTDTGDVLQINKRGVAYPRSLRVLCFGLEGAPLTINCHPQLEGPREGPTELASLAGALQLYSEVKATEIRIEPDSVGKTFTQDDCAATVESWEADPYCLAVTLKEKHPLRPDDPRTRENPNDDCHLAALVLKDGREVPSMETSQERVYAGEDGAYSVRFNFRVVPDIAYLRLTVLRRGPADKTLPFVVEHIPLP
jgi:hypothetical protein